MTVNQALYIHIVNKFEENLHYLSISVSLDDFRIKKFSLILWKLCNVLGGKFINNALANKS